ncbi:hypothetical protein [Bacteroides stercorirosoris]|uniref:hypothetical protein n=1 Tax=Bacteroides stercorirosoris TaxID=871324 RepID=UPI000ABB7DF7|nr:hypothetical protein [Bacteroides stercorirosoris]
MTFVKNDGFTENEETSSTIGFHLLNGLQYYKFTTQYSRNLIKVIVSQTLNL